MKLSDKIFNKKCSVEDLRDELKKLIRIYDKDRNKIKKKELLTVRDAIKSFLEDIKCSNYREFKFGSNIVQLNNEQYNIVTADNNKNMRIIACAGSGKTTTILCRIKRLIASGVEPNKILLMSFNVDACQQLRTKITDLFGFLPNVDICTIDSFSCRYYNMYKDNIGITYNASVSEFCCIIAKYMKTSQGTKITNKYKYVFFDEFQDVNQDQFDIMKQFSNNGCIVTVIGDDAQNIYTFRGTNVAYIMNFDKYVENVDTYMLTRNYRSTPEIINMANESIIHNGDQLKKEMIAVNKSINIKPKIIIFDDIRYEYEYVIYDILSSFKQGIKLDDIAILSRNQEPLKLIEEIIYKHNRDIRKEHINLVALITEDNTNTKPKIQPDHITLTTIHKSKGLEWKKVYLIDCCDRYFPNEIDNISIQEERRLFYVAVTRAKTHLIMPISSKSFPMTRFVSEIPTELYDIKNDTKYEIKDIFKYDNDREPKLEYSVTDVVKMFRPTDIINLREKGILPDLFPHIDTLYDRTYNHNKNVNKYYLHTDFGEFIDRYITRCAMEKDKILKSYEDYQAIRVICSIEEPTKYIRLYEKHLFPLLRNYDLIENNSDVIIDDKYVRYLNIEINKMKLQYNEFDELKRISKKIFVNSKRFGILPHKIPVIRIGYLPNEFKSEMEKSYNVYKNIINKTDDILKDVYKISLCGNILNKRRRLLYKDVFTDFTDDHMQMLDDISLYVNKYSSKHFECKKRVSKLWVKGMINLCGEIDLFNVDDSIIVDYKCSTDKGDINIEWIIQMLLYVALLDDEKINSTRELEIFNPMMGKVYKYSLAEWNKGKDFLDFVYEIIMRSKREKMDQFDNKIFNDSIKLEMLTNNMQVLDHDTNQNSKNDSNNVETVQCDTKYISENELKCNICDKIFIKKSGLVSHQRKKNKCEKLNNLVQN